MKKLKKIWQENSVLLVLLLILIACLIAISIVVVTYFVGSSNTKYGDRLEGIEKYPFNEDTQKEIISKIKLVTPKEGEELSEEEDPNVEDVKIEVSGKRIIVRITFKAGTTITEGQNKALASLDYFDEKTLEFYDVEYEIKADKTEEADGFQISGSHNATGSGGVNWTRNTMPKEEEEEEE